MRVVFVFKVKQQPIYTKRTSTQSFEQKKKHTQREGISAEYIEALWRKMEYIDQCCGGELSILTPRKSKKNTIGLLYKM